MHRCDANSPIVAVVVAERPEQEVVNARSAAQVSDEDAQREGDDTKSSAHDGSIQLTGFQSSHQLDVKIDEPSLDSGDLQSAAPGKAIDAEPHAVQFDEVVSSVYRSYPMLESALLNRNIALGQQVGARGAFDLKLKGASENGPQGFYQTYRQSIGVVQPTYGGGEVFAGYRIGRGDFQPWYLERQTNGGGEFKAGVLLPLARNRDIDTRRAELWKAGYGRNLAEPDIQAQLISFVLDASYAYWDWVAAGENHHIAKRIYALADERTDRIEEQVKAGFLDPPELNAVLWGSQDVGAPTSFKGNKSPFESEASVFLDVPMQRRKARGKMTETQSKIAQLSAKRRITADKISIDVQMAHAALRSAWEQVERTSEAVEYAEDLAARERTNEEAGVSDMLKVSLREQYAYESAEKNVEALKLYFESRADYRAAMAEDQIDR